MQIWGSAEGDSDKDTAKLHCALMGLLTHLVVRIKHLATEHPHVSPPMLYSVRYAELTLLIPLLTNNDPGNLASHSTPILPPNVSNICVDYKLPLSLEE